MRTPVHFVSGPGAREWAARAQAARPDWAVLTSNGCPCCTGRVVLQVTLARILRAQRPSRILVVTAVETHARAALATLREPPLAAYIIGGRALCLPQDSAVLPGDLEGAERAGDAAA
ncbi:MAG: hypothetical protein O2975_03280 [Proteobacteria bacterium]|nr:hypothetical protein [Pseudomonadota bacterium]